MDRPGFLWVGGGVLGAGALAWWQRNAIARAALSRRVNADVRLSAAPSPEDDMCVLTAAQDEGPFFVRAPVRRDIREDRAGLPLTLRMQLVKADSCRPVQGAMVEVWHCDAAGGYSGYRADLARKPVDTMLYLGGLDAHLEPTHPGTFLRGAQATAPDGTVEFHTIFPGWYEPRVPHVHAKVFVEGASHLTTQLYFPDDLAREVHATHREYVPHGTPPYTLRNDLILGRQPGADGLLLHPARVGEQMVASCRLGIA
ncbi:MAG: protocatechuate 3,4-dioxygenase [Gammaproteobacteria bacterium]|nr:protocatechuate 3,4-dioxygenase [Gammaproteobacteria bacterium]